MKKDILYTLICISSLTILLTGCTNHTDSASNAAVDNQPPDVTVSDEAVPEDSDTQDEPEADPIQTIELSYNNSYGDTLCGISLLGLEETDHLSSEDVYEDQAPEGFKYVIAYLAVENRCLKATYLNPELLKTIVDGEAVQNTFLFNNPNDYPTIWGDLPEQQTKYGYIVWQVPESWEQLSFSYEGWKDISQVIINVSLTKKDLKAPPKLTDQMEEIR